MRPRFLLLCTLFAAAAEAKIDFSRQVRPILSDTCFTCHGPDEKRRMANLRLDLKEGAAAVMAGGRQGKFWQRVAAADPKRRMPPASHDRTLSKEQIELIGKWIDEGGEWKQHWSYAAPTRPEPPAPGDAKWVRNAIDNFVLARLDKEGLKPSPEADRATLIRRVTLDLTGLPPTPEEIAAFLADRTGGAYEKVVTRLLDSPHYGERMALQWLDLARYADTHGYHIDSHRDMWPWRDWVIHAFNSNMPYDRFTVEQLAGDLLPGATREQRLATGFNRNHNINFEGGAIAEEYQTEYVVDRVEATSNVWMGMTMGCARCHDHKYDPISQRDFYRFFAFFNTIEEKGLDGREGNAEPKLQLPDAVQEQRMAEVKQAIASREVILNAKETGAGQTEWAATASPAPGPRGALAHYEMEGAFSDLSGHYRHGRVTKGNPLFVNGPAGQAAAFDGESVVEFGNLEPAGIAFWLRSNNRLRQEILSNGKLTIGLEESVSIGDLKRGARLTVRLGPAAVRTHGFLQQSAYTHVVVNAGNAAGLAIYLDGVRADTEPVESGPAGAARTLATGASLRSNLDDLRIYSRPLTAAEARELAVDAPALAILQAPVAKRAREHAERLREYYLTYAAPEPVRKAHAELKELRAQKTKLDKLVVNAMVMEEMGKARETFILGRGDYRNKTEKVTAAVPANLPPLPPGAKADRLGLARWLTDPSHPLTARVAVNRYWQLYFGTGLVETVEDFGSQGAPPSHPELLDWLASEFLSSGWNVKQMQKLIVMSSTYRQSSKATPELTERDPSNRLLARMSRFRLPAEAIRDNALASSGLLNPEIGGPSVYPYEPAGLWEETAYGDVYSAQTYKPGHGKDLYRRGMYTFWKRTVPPAAMSAFDAPDREKCVARRSRTNTPLQALVLLNDPTYIESARAMAQRVVLKTKDPAARVRLAYQMAAARTPLAPEVKLLTGLAVDQRATFTKDPAAAKKLIATGESKPDPAVDPVELAAWTMVASAILNLDETITKE